MICPYGVTPQSVSFQKLDTQKKKRKKNIIIVFEKIFVILHF